MRRGTDIDAISAMQTIQIDTPMKHPMYIQIKPPVPPLTSPKMLALSVASQVAMSTIVKPKMDTKRKLRRSCCFLPMRHMSLLSSLVPTWLVRLSDVSMSEVVIVVIVSFIVKYTFWL